MKASEVIKKILAEHGEITEVYWVACGGSLIDLYPSHFMLTVESAKTSSGWHTAKEFLVATPKKLGKHSMVVMCSHSGNTKEAVDAAVLAYERGAAVVTLVMWSMTTFDTETTIASIVTAHVFLSIGLGFMFTPLLTGALGSLPKRLYSYGSAVVGTVQQVAGAAGTAAFIAVMTAVATSHVEGGMGAVAAEAGGIHVAFILGAAITTLAFFATFLVRRSEPAE